MVKCFILLFKSETSVKGTENIINIVAIVKLFYLSTNSFYSGAKSRVEYSTFTVYAHLHGIKFA